MIINFFDSPSIYPPPLSAPSPHSKARRLPLQIAETSISFKPLSYNFPFTPQIDAHSIFLVDERIFERYSLRASVVIVFCSNTNMALLQSSRAVEPPQLFLCMPRS
jgi:hypothetical protein